MSTKSKGGPPAFGTTDWRRCRSRDCGEAHPGIETHWHVRLSLVNGKRSPWIPLDPYIAHEDRDAAKAGAKDVSDKARASGLVAGNVETVGGWFKRFHDYKAARGLSSVDDMRSRARLWILPGIEFKSMAEVGREHVEAIVRRLDAAIVEWETHDGGRGEGRLSPSTAANVWGDVVHAFDEAVRSKDPSLRVLAESPCANARGPETGADREGPILYSDEIVALLRGKAVDPGAPDVPLYRRRVWAMALYTKTRRSELAALTPADVDLVHGTIAITKQVDRAKKATDAKATKKTKTKRTRTIDVEPNVRALVEQLVARPEGRGGRLVRMPPIEDYAELLRKDLWTIGARDPRLHTDDSTRTKMTGHDLRDTGLTHMAVRGDSPIAIQWAAGHTDFKMTQGYIDHGRVEARRIGAPLPPLPAEVLGEQPAAKDATDANEEAAESAEPSDPAPVHLSPHLSGDGSGGGISSDIQLLSATPTGIEGNAAKRASACSTSVFLAQCESAWC